MFKNYKRMYLYHKEMHEHYSELFKVASNELRYRCLIEQSLYNMIDEIKTLLEITNDEKDSLILKIIENGIERYNLDKIIHAKKLFPNPQGFTKKFRDNVLQEEEDTA